MYQEINSDKSVYDDHKLKCKSTQDGIAFLSFKRDKKIMKMDLSLVLLSISSSLSALSNT